MSRHGSIFYDAPEALSVLLLNEDKDEIEKMVKKSKNKISFKKTKHLTCSLSHQQKNFELS